MATIKKSEVIHDIRGGVDSHVYSSWRGKGYLRSKAPVRTNPCSQTQANLKAGQTSLAKAWYDSLTKPQRDLWEEFAQQSKITPDPASSYEQGSRVIIPQPKSVLSGYNAFIRVNQRAFATSIRAIGNPILVPSRISPNAPTNLREFLVPIPGPNFALTLDGVNEYVNCGNVLNYEYNQPQAWEFWLKSTGDLSNDTVIVKTDPAVQDGYRIHISAGNLIWCIIRLSVGEKYGVKRAVAPISSWTQWICTHDANWPFPIFKIFRNSVVGQVWWASVSVTGTIIVPDPLTFGMSVGLPIVALSGSMDRIRNFNRNLVQADVNILWNGGAGRKGTDPFGDGSCQGNWGFCEGAGMVLGDTSGNNYHGNLINMEEGDWGPGQVPCPDVPGLPVIAWDEPPGLPAGSKVRIWVLSYDAGVHKQHIGTVDIGVEFFAFDTVRVAQGKTVPVANMPGHYLIQADIVDPNGNVSPPSNTIEWTIP